MLGLASFVALTAAEPAPRAQPLLLEMAAEHPEATVGVIVQKVAKDESIEDLVTVLGGVVTKDLHIINALSAELPAKAVPLLAQASGVRWVSLDAPVLQAESSITVDTSQLQNAYIRTIRADQVWNTAPYAQGQGITVAVVDSGINAKHSDLKTDPLDLRSRVVAEVKFNSTGKNQSDWYGHGTHIAGTIGGNGATSGGAYIGVAPQVNLVNVKVSDDQGTASASDVVSGLQWIYENKDKFNIRVVNLSLNSSSAESYHTSPLDAAVELLWFNGVVVVVSAGNNGTSGILYPPANDPFVITVGATDDRVTADPADDVLAGYSAYGTTESGFAKPDLVAPGTNITSLLASSNARLAREHPDHLVNDSYFRMSGTSMASAVTAGGVALLLQDEPGLNPDQVKYRLKATAHPLTSPGTGAGSLDTFAAVHDGTTETANTGVTASQLLWMGSTPISSGSVSWGSVSWGSVSWGSVSWSSVSWGSDYWGPE
ncbi:MAG TPA: peptidase S8 [Chloroflexi bacterium]|nr:peptidase S8 [Chloroflexota bacterium]